MYVKSRNVPLHQGVKLSVNRSTVLELASWHPAGNLVFSGLLFPAREGAGTPAATHHELLQSNAGPG